MVMRAAQRWLGCSGALCFLAAGATPTPPTGAAPLLVRSCAGCHASGSPGGRDLRLFDAAGRLDLAVVRAERALILATVAGNHGRPRLTPAEVATLRRWLDAGAPGG